MAKVLITGANGGFGRLTVEALLARHHEVVAGMRDLAGRNRVAAGELQRLGARVVQMDVTDDGCVERGVAESLRLLGHLDAVVNNAGFGVVGVQESFTPDDWRRVFDVNVFGVQRVNRAVLPDMRARRSGLLLHVSSLLGRITIPFYGPYNASKWALEALAENYRVELAGFGIDVALVEPGGYPTSFVNALVRPSDRSRDASLGSLPADAEAFLAGFEKTLAAVPAQDPQRVADAIVDVIETPAGRRAFRTTVDTLGMSAAIDPYNEELARITRRLYGALGIAKMLEIKQPAR